MGVTFAFANGLSSHGSSSPPDSPNTESQPPASTTTSMASRLEPTGHRESNAIAARRRDDHGLFDALAAVPGIELDAREIDLVDCPTVERDLRRPVVRNELDLERRHSRCERDRLGLRGVFRVVLARLGGTYLGAPEPFQRRRQLVELFVAK